MFDLTLQEKGVLFPNNVDNEDIEELKKRIVILDDRNFEGKKIDELYLKVNKNSVDMALLFKFSYELLRQSNNHKVRNGIERFEGSYFESCRLLEEYYKPIAFGKNRIYNRIQDFIGNGISNRLMDLIDFTFVNFVIVKKEAGSGTDLLMEKIRGLQDERKVKGD